LRLRHRSHRDLRHLVAGVPHEARRRLARDRGRSVDGGLLRDSDQVGVRLDLRLWLRACRACRRLAQPALRRASHNAGRLARHGGCRRHCRWNGKHHRRGGRGHAACAGSGPRQPLDSAGLGRDARLRRDAARARGAARRAVQPAWRGVMLHANVPPVEPQPSLKAAARLNVGDRLLQALYPPPSSATQLRWLGLAMLALAAIFPWLGGPFYTRLAIESFLFGAIALSVDILLGYAGLLSLGQAADFGLAAYISALMHLHVTQSFWLVLLAVVAAVAVFSLVLGAVAIRAKGVYFALITFGAAEILSKIAHNTRAIGGSDGLIGIPVPHIALLPGVTIDLQ